LNGIKEESIGKNATALLEKIHSLWVEKYRPQNINELAASKEIKRFLTKVIAESMIAEPVGKNTAPAVGLPMKYISKRL